MTLKNKKHTIVISCGGTGGHLKPGITIGEELKKSEDVRVVYLTNEKKVTHHFFQGDLEQCERVNFPELEFSKLKSLYLFKLIFLIFKCIYLTFILWKRYRPISFFVSMGNSTGIIPFYFFKLLNCPVSICEQNVIMGKANRLLYPHVDKAFLSFNVKGLKKDSKSLLTGNPIPLGWFEGEENICSELSHLKAGDFTLLIMGGSQGAQSINEFALEWVPKLKKKVPELQVIHLTGLTLYNECSELYKKNDIKCFCQPFFEDMSALYRRASFAISRAGGGSISELAAFGIPTLLIPYPYASDDHQTWNAKNAAKNGGAIVMDTKELFNGLNQEHLIECIEDANKLSEMREEQLAFAKRDAVKVIAEKMKHLMGIFKGDLN